MKLLPYLPSKQSPVRAESIVSTVMWLWMLAATVAGRSIAALLG